ncbi:SDR family oxidoreductase [Devosia sp.]|uniref:SDR family oxidoreductase n=1 Tax=Devosia sp. TaxID=1871048 RepID=UPI003A93554E
MRLFFFGMGYSSRATAQALRNLENQDIPVAGTTRSLESAEDWADTSYDMHVFDGEVPGPTLSADLRQATHVILSIPPDERGDAALNLHRADLDAAENLEWIGYFSTVGVYGDFGGQWIDEDAPTRPVNPRSKQRVAAEEAWRDYAKERGVPLFIERLAGIYGPGRSAFDKLRAGTARRIVKPGQVFNRIHVTDIGEITALAARARLAGTYNLTDTEPAPPQDLVSYAADLMGVAPPPDTPFETAPLSPMARSFYSDNKRVSSKRLLAALDTELRFPTYREGLNAIWETHQ